MADIDKQLQALRESSGHGMTRTSSEPTEAEVKQLAADIRKRDLGRRRTKYQAKVAEKIKDVGTAASLTPYDAGLGDLAYAGGELLDPERDTGKAATAAGLGLATGGVGSGAFVVRAINKMNDAEKLKDMERILREYKDISDWAQKHEPHIDPEKIKRWKDAIQKADFPAPLKQSLFTQLKEVIQDITSSLGPGMPTAKFVELTEAATRAVEKQLGTDQPEPPEHVIPKKSMRPMRAEDEDK